MDSEKNVQVLATSSMTSDVVIRDMHSQRSVRSSGKKIPYHISKTSEMFNAYASSAGKTNPTAQTPRSDQFKSLSHQSSRRPAVANRNQGKSTVRLKNFHAQHRVLQGLHR
jgi:hypothetical protein